MIEYLDSNSLAFLSIPFVTRSPSLFPAGTSGGYTCCLIVALACFNRLYTLMAGLFAQNLVCLMASSNLMPLIIFATRFSFLGLHRCIGSVNQNGFPYLCACLCSAAIWRRFHGVALVMGV